ncbi:hypothetical protein MLD38_032328 [Melastoma candidum]|uniref:Uncharacterized protein n=1 Tax=Melastoma candidum TaxID=119954 RepID=A0ACB9M3F0_9MYRT|nr:hypothetical protein MLD38_032328 [Melastoma candidum]
MEEELDEEEEEQEVWSWGAGTEGQLGTESEKDELLPRLVSCLSSVSVSALSCGGAHVIALASGGEVFSWGRGSSGQLGQGDLVARCLKPAPISSLESIPIASVSAGWNHSGFVSRAGCPFTCGDGSFGQLGHGDYRSYPFPMQVPFFASHLVSRIACGMRHSIVVCKGESEFSVYGFGSCKRGQIGSSSSHAKSVGLPQHIPGLDGVEIVGLSANGDHSAALSADGRLYSWGRGFPGAPDACIPQLLPSSQLIKEACLGWNHALSLTDDGEVLMLGGKLHSLHNDPALKSLASQQSGVTWEKVPGPDRAKVIQIAAGAEHSALVNEDGSVMTWGWGEHGQLGLGDTSDQILPQTVNLSDGLPFTATDTTVYCGSGFTFVVRKHQRKRPSTIN